MRIFLLLSCLLCLSPSVFSQGDKAENLPDLPAIHFSKKSADLSKRAKKQLDSILRIAHSYPSKCLVISMPFGWENIKLNELIWNRGHKAFYYLEKKRLLNKTISALGANEMDVHSIHFRLAECETELSAPQPNLKTEKSNQPK